MGTTLNRRWFNVASAPGTGDVAVGSALAGHLSLGAAHDGLTFDGVIYLDGSDFEVRNGCTYTHGTTTLSRGTLEESSTGLAISLSSSTTVMLSVSADAIRRYESAALVPVAGPDANTTMEAGKLYLIDGSTLTADRTYTLPGTAKVGDCIGVKVSVDSPTYEVLLTAGGGDTLEGVAGGTEWSRVFIRGEIVIMECTAANAAWEVVQDGRVPCHSVVSGIYTVTASASAQQVTFTASEQKLNVGNVSIAASERFFSARRAGVIEIGVSVDFNASATARYIWPVIRLNGGSSGLQATIFAAARSGSSAFGTTQTLPISVGDYVDITIEQNDSSSEACGYAITCKESF